MENRTSKTLNTINHPLSFFALALLIIEGFLGVVLVLSDLNNDQKFFGMKVGVILFILVVGFVWILVWAKPKNIILEGKDHVEMEKINKGVVNLEETKNEATLADTSKIIDNLLRSENI